VKVQEFIEEGEISLEADKERIEKVKREMELEGFDALWCRLPENVLYLSGYWPVIGASAILFPLDGDPVLIAPVDEIDYTSRSWVKDIKTFKFLALEAVTDANRDISKILKEVAWDKRLEKAVIGYEGSYELIAANHVGGEARYPGFPALNMLKETVSKATFRDAKPSLTKLRVTKTQLEIEILRKTNEIACFGFDAAREVLEPGIKESAVAAAVEGRIHAEGIGYNITERARGFAFVMSGPSSANSWRPFYISTDRKIRKGDMVLVELDTYADGYWSDLTRTFVVGEPDKKEHEIWDIVLLAEQRAIEAIHGGVKAAEIDAFARSTIEEKGYGKYFLHGLGHGVGLAFHEPPTLHPASKDILLPGMTHAVEPSICIPEWGGMRVEDNVLVTEKKAIFLSDYDRGL